jgi:sec-independent protein translocase protein TatA
MPSPAVDRYHHGVDIGTGELIIILAVVLLLFGGTQLPKLARSLGQAQNEFKKGIKEGADKDKDDDEPTA